MSDTLSREGSHGQETVTTALLEGLDEADPSISQPRWMVLKPWGPYLSIQLQGCMRKLYSNWFIRHRGW